MKESLPDWSSIPDRYVEEFHGALDQLSETGFDVSEFKIPSGDLDRIMTPGNYLTGETHYSTDRHVPRPLFLGKPAEVLLPVPLIRRQR